MKTYNVIKKKSTDRQTDTQTHTDTDTDTHTHTHTPVSYTHLDVYKRQILFRIF